MPHKGEVVLEVKDMYKNFGITAALDHVNFVLKGGEVRGLIGENDSGKSTVYSIASGIQKATSGEMFYLAWPALGARQRIGGAEKRHPRQPALWRKERNVEKCVMKDCI